MMSALSEGEAIVIEHFSKSYRMGFFLRRVSAVRDVSLTVRRGEIYGFLGPNGAGKTTTLKALVGLIRPDRGRLRVLGGTPDDPDVRRRIGFMPENPYFYDYLTVWEFLDFHASLYGIPKAERRRRIEEYLERVKMTEHAKKRIRQLSRGMLQRIGLAQALIGDPEVLILDEPMSGLDPVGRWEMRELLRSLRGQKTIFFSSHILHDAEVLCDRVGIIFQGRIIAEGTVGELIGSSIEGYEVTLEGVPETASLGPAQILSRQDRQVYLWTQPADLSAVMDVAHTNGWRVVAVTPQKRSLEDLFMTLVQAR
jgi:ABC-2 type transport system ATP-binding protein